MRSLVMSDVETNSEWAHLLGRAMAGKLKGKVLRPLITDMVTWKVWLEQYPQTTVLKMSATAKDFTRDFYRDRSRFVFGFAIGSKSFALPMEKMSDHPLHAFKLFDESLIATFDRNGTSTHLFDAELDGEVLEFALADDGTMKDRQTGSVWKTTTGQAVSGPMKGKSLRQRVGIMSFRKAWINFHPESSDVEF